MTKSIQCLWVCDSKTTNNKTCGKRYVNNIIIPSDNVPHNFFTLIYIYTYIKSWDMKNNLQLRLCQLEKIIKFFVKYWNLRMIKQNNFIIKRIKIS